MTDTRHIKRCIIYTTWGIKNNNNNISIQIMHVHVTFSQGIQQHDWLLDNSRCKYSTQIIINKTQFSKCFVSWQTA